MDLRMCSPFTNKSRSASVENASVNWLRLKQWNLTKLIIGYKQSPDLYVFTYFIEYCMRFTGSKVSGRLKFFFVGGECHILGIPDYLKNFVYVNVFRKNFFRVKSFALSQNNHIRLIEFSTNIDLTSCKYNFVFVKETVCKNQFILI